VAVRVEVNVRIKAGVRDRIVRSLFGLRLGSEFAHCYDFRLHVDGFDWLFGFGVGFGLRLMLGLGLALGSGLYLLGLGLR
jgi:hypothetical protein